MFRRKFDKLSTLSQHNNASCLLTEAYDFPIHRLLLCLIVLDMNFFM